MAEPWQHVWKTPQHQNSGVGLGFSPAWPEGVFLDVRKNDSIEQYQIGIHILRSNEAKPPYSVYGELVFNGLTIETKEVVENIIPFQTTVLDAKFQYFTTVVGMPLGNNDFWPSCHNAVFTVRYNIGTKSSNNLNSMLKEAKHSYDMWLSGADGKVVGLHECVAKVNCSKMIVPPFTSASNPFPIKVGSFASITYVVERMYQLPTQDMKETSIEFLMEVYEVCINLSFTSVLPKIEQQMVQLKPNFKALHKLCKDYPNVVIFQQALLTAVSKDIQAYISLMDEQERIK